MTSPPMPWSAPSVRGRGRIVAREPVVVAGLAVAAEVFRRVDAATDVDDRWPRTATQVAAGGALLRGRRARPGRCCGPSARR